MQKRIGCAVPSVTTAPSPQGQAGRFLPATAKSQSGQPESSEAAHAAVRDSLIEHQRRRGSSVEEALVEMYLAGVSVRRVEDITEAL